MSIRPNLLLGALALSLAACGSNASAPPPLSPLPVDAAGDSALGSGDVITIEVFGEKQLSGKFRVSAKGTIDYPFMPGLRVVGLTPPEVSALIRQKLGEGYLKDPSVSVFVEVYTSKKISVLGQVTRPGTFNYMNNMTIIEGITLAGGFTPLAAKNSITVTRVEQGRSRRITVPVEEIGEGKASNFLLRPGDIVFVAERLF